MARAKCAVFGIFNSANPDEKAAQSVYYGLHAQQHRGQESAGICSFVPTDPKDKKPRKRQLKHTMACHKDFGLVLDVFDDPALFARQLRGSAALGHTRYSTSGSDKSLHNIQPFTVHYKHGNLALAHNGNLSNFSALHDMFVEKGTLFSSTSDSELVLHLIAQSKEKTQELQIMDALGDIEGAFSLVLMTDQSMFAVRDPNGFRPLVLGRIGDADQEGGAAYCVASETCAFDLIDATFVREVEPGEVLCIDKAGCANGGKFRSFHLENRSHQLTPCVFEYIYFARPDSRVFGSMVQDVRSECGKLLANEQPPPKPGKGEPAVVVCAVPDSANVAAMGYHKELQRMGYRSDYEFGIIRNHYVGRTFITPSQNARELKVRCKFNTVRKIFENKVVVLVDDSIVRGTTSKQLIKMVKKAGAKEVHFRVASPPVVAPCFYGMDFPSKGELIANNHKDTPAVAKWLHADSLGYMSVAGVMKAVRNTLPSSDTYCDACFTGFYPVPVHHLLSEEDKRAGKVEGARVAEEEKRSRDW